MKKESIVQFVCFSTDLESGKFFSQWEPYSKQLATAGDSLLMEAAGFDGKNKYRYILQHQSHAKDFLFAFMKKRSKEGFPEHRSRVVEAGGYTAVQVECPPNKTRNEVRVLAFIGHDEMDMDFYYRQVYSYLNIYQAYYENCVYSYVLEFFIQEQDAPALLDSLKTRTGINVNIYKECPVFAE